MTMAWSSPTLPKLENPLIACIKFCILVKVEDVLLLQQSTLHILSAL